MNLLLFSYRLVLLHFNVIFFYNVVSETISSKSCVSKNKGFTEMLNRHRVRRYLSLGKGLAVTANIGKSIVSQTPKGLNEIAEYTFIYELPFLAPSQISTTSKSFFEAYMKRSTDNVPKMPQFNSFFYDIIEVWSLIMGFIPRYCFMRTLCEAPHLILPPEHCLLHDLIYHLYQDAKIWAPKFDLAFAQAIEPRLPWHCARFYGPHCRVSWLKHLTELFCSSSTSEVVL